MSQFRVRFRPTTFLHLSYRLPDMLFPRTTSNCLRAGQTLPSFFAIISIAFMLVFPSAGQQTSTRGSEQDRNAILQLDDEYQAAVKKNDAATMARHLSDDYMLVSSSGKTYFKPDMLAEAKSGTVVYEIQDDTDRTVRFYGDTAVLTGKLHEKGTQDGKPFDVWVVFSDVYMRRAGGWIYVFAQAARLPAGNP
ncbi:nuclear transport factor 2 family protein [Candidatus Korobacter versatilis]|nr:nuclear transport factor 2 family protein [Candidatus Koribacter versatilis]